MIYEEVFHEFDGTTMLTNIKGVNDDLIMLIPIDPANTDYQAYLAWKAEQPTPKGKN